MRDMDIARFERRLRGLGFDPVARRGWFHALDGSARVEAVLRNGPVPAGQGRPIDRRRSLERIGAHVFGRAADTNENARVAARARAG